MSVTEIDDELAALPEFAFLNDNAEQAGVTGPSPNVERIDRGPISALEFGAAYRARSSFMAAGRMRTPGTR
jgi:hypothetical protein